jgi:hypothetical protein
MPTIRLASATVAQAKLEGITDMAKFFKHHLFLAGLKESLHDKVLEAQKDTFSQSLKLARELESIQNNHKRWQKIAAVKAELQPDEVNNIIWDNLTEGDFEQVATNHARNNGYLPKKNPNSPAHNNGQVENSSPRNLNIICLYCIKKGHLQKECFWHQRDNTPAAQCKEKTVH